MEIRGREIIKNLCIENRKWTVPAYHPTQTEEIDKTLTSLKSSILKKFPKKKYYPWHENKTIKEWDDIFNQAIDLCIKAVEKVMK